MSLSAALRVLAGDATPVLLTLGHRPITLGRSSQCSLVLGDEHVSRLHARIDFADGQWLLSDLLSLNGTFVDGERISQPVALHDSQVIGIGDIRVAVQMHYCCPDLAEVEKLHQGDGSARAFADFLTHAESCDACLERIKDFSAGDSLMEALRGTIRLAGADPHWPGLNSFLDVDVANLRQRAEKKMP